MVEPRPSLALVEPFARRRDAAERRARLVAGRLRIETVTHQGLRFEREMCLDLAGKLVVFAISGRHPTRIIDLPVTCVQWRVDAAV
jgi:hypothetical protein